ncbi:MAG TPA: hypothetical protein VGB15_20080 [Longimicrobium sp.]|jgi:hypothetical protein
MRRDPPSVRRKRQAAIYTAPVEPPMPMWVRLVIVFAMLLIVTAAAWAAEIRRRECREHGGAWETRPVPGHCVPR